MVAITHVEGQVLVHCSADGEVPVCFLIDADHANGAGLGNRLRRRVSWHPLFGLLRLATESAFASRLLVGSADRVDTHCIDGAIGADGAGQLADDGDWSFLREIDDFRALQTRHFQTILTASDSEHAVGAFQLCTHDRELPNGTTAEDRHSVAVGDLCQIGGEIARGEDVR